MSTMYFGVPCRRGENVVYEQRRRCDSSLRQCYDSVYGRPPLVVVEQSTVLCVAVPCERSIKPSSHYVVVRVLLDITLSTTSGYL